MRSPGTSLGKVGIKLKLNYVPSVCSFKFPIIVINISHKYFNMLNYFNNFFNNVTIYSDAYYVPLSMMWSVRCLKNVSSMNKDLAWDALVVSRLFVYCVVRVKLETTFGCFCCLNSVNTLSNLLLQHTISLLHWYFFLSLCYCHLFLSDFLL